MKPVDADPIAAIATASGRGAIGVVRVSGQSLHGLVHALFGRALAPRVATLLPFLAADGTALDTGLVVFFPAPHSYTGEDVLELQAHGGPVLLQLCLERVLEAGAPWGVRLAEPGEFTRRAFLNDKMDLAQAEAVADLIEASSAQAVRAAHRSLTGAWSQAVHAVVAQLIDLRMLVEATLDFPEEEIDFLEQADARGRLEKVSKALATLRGQARQGALLRDGLHVVLVGAPNVGKSSLLNALAGAEVAIVTPIAGTTRDRIEQAIQIEGVPLVVIDTAGLRISDDPVEQIGMSRTREAIARADVIVHLGVAQPEGDADTRVDARVALNDEWDPVIMGPCPSATPVLRVWNKIDALASDPRVEEDAVWLSALTGAGLPLLRAALLRCAGWQDLGEGAWLARTRHLQALAQASEHVQHAQTLAQARAQSLDLMAEELRLAQEELNRITGEFGADDLLGVIFQRFCIGK